MRDEWRVNSRPQAGNCAGAALPPPSIQMPKGGSRTLGGGPQKEGHDHRSCPSFWQGVTIQILSGRSNSLAFKFAIFLEKHPTGLLAGGAFAPYKRFATGKTLTQGEFTSPEHFNHRRVERPTGAKPKRKCDLSKQVAFSFGAADGSRTHLCSLGSCRSTDELQPQERIVL